ncbi:MAG: hypothetical protein AMXMBFR23_26370 [Chloroflexota bacterium]
MAGEDARMSTIPPRINLVTLGVGDLARSLAFYEALGWRASSASVPGVVAFVRTAGPVLGLFPYGELQADAGLQRAPRPDGFGGITLAVNVETEGAVAGCLAAAVAAGGTLLKAATRAEWGGVTGYFADPDGYPWEVAYNPGFPFDDRGLLALPE